MSNKDFNEKYIHSLRVLTEELGSPNKAFYTVIPQSIARFYFFDTNNTYAVLVTLMSWVNQNGCADVSRNVLADNSRVKVRTVDKALKELVAKNFIIKKRNVCGNINEANSYMFRDLTKNPYLLLSEAIHICKKGIRNVGLRESVANFVSQVESGEFSILLKRIDIEASRDVISAFKIACAAVAEHLKNDLDIDIEISSLKKKNPAQAKAGKSVITSTNKPRNREWIETNNDKPKIYF